MAVSAAHWCCEKVSAAAAGAAQRCLCKMEGKGKGMQGKNPSICKNYRKGYFLSVKLNGLEGGS